MKIDLINAPCINACQICGKEYFNCDMQAHFIMDRYLVNHLQNMTKHCAVLFPPVSCAEDYTAVFISQRFTINAYRQLLDEQYLCGYGQFQCMDKSCVLDIILCDGVLDCVDESDENFVECYYINYTFSLYIFSDPLTVYSLPTNVK